MRRCNRSEDGSTLVGAMFLLVVLAAVSGYLLSVNAAQRDAAVDSLLGTRAALAAAAGLEYALDDIVNGGAAALACAPPGTVAFTLTEGALAGFDVSIGCRLTAVTEGASSYTLYDLEATASRGTIGGPGYVRRRLVASAAF